MGSLLVTYLAISGTSPDLAVDTSRRIRLSSPRDLVFLPPRPAWVLGPLTSLRPLLSPLWQPIRGWQLL